MNSRDSPSAFSRTCVAIRFPRQDKLRAAASNCPPDATIISERLSRAAVLCEGGGGKSFRLSRAKRNYVVKVAKGKVEKAGDLHFSRLRFAGERLRPPIAG